MDTHHRLTARPPAILAAAAAILALVILAPALLSFGSPSASGLSPQLADAPPGLVPLALQAGAATGIAGNVLLAIAKVETDWGRARQAQPDDLVPADIRAAVDAAALQPDGTTAQLLGLPDGRRIGDWVNPSPVGTEHAMGFVQFLPSTWRAEAAEAPGGPRDPYRPLDAMTVVGSYLHRIEVGAVSSRQRDLRSALAVYGGSTAYADQVLALAEPATTSGLPVVLPIPAPGWFQCVPTPSWPADLAAHMSPSAVTKQCMTGALATWAVMHVGDPRMNRPPPLFGNAIDLFSAWRGPQGFAVSGQPVAGQMVVYGSSYGVFGHIAAVVAVEPGRYEVIEQNFLDFNPVREPHWTTVDLRLVARPDPGVVGFVVGPPGG